MDDKINEYYAKTKSSTPDGVMDASSYIDTVKTIVDATRHLGSDSDDQGRFIVEIVNIFVKSVGDEFVMDEDKVMETITALSFGITMMLKLAESFNEDFPVIFQNTMRDLVLPELEKESKAVPYWND